MESHEKLERAGLYLITAIFLYGMAYMPLKEHANIRIIPDSWIEKFPVHGEIYKPWNRVPVDPTNTIITNPSSQNSLDSLVVPAKTKADGTSVIQRLAKGFDRILD